MHIYIYTYIHIYIYTYIQIHIYTYRHAYTCSFMKLYMHILIHTNGLLHLPNFEIVLFIQMLYSAPHRIIVGVSVLPTPL